jgi:hypothetical protein
MAAQALAELRRSRREVRKLGNYLRLLRYKSLLRLVNFYAVSWRSICVICKIETLAEQRLCGKPHNDVDVILSIESEVACHLPKRDPPATASG